MSEPAPRGDHFSNVAESYAAFRPTYPPELFDYVASIAPRRDRAWDCGCGSGQATLPLAERFERVIATDVSARQIAQAPSHPGIEWHVAPAEHVPIADGSIDLVTIAQALHWLDFDRFYAECRRVASPGAAIAAWTYGSPSMEGAVGRALSEFMYGDAALGPYWPPERDHVTHEYRTIPFPFERIDAPRMELVHHWTPAQVAGYLRSMSATARYVQANGRTPVPDFENELAALWPDGAPRRIAWPLVILAGRIARTGSASRSG